MTTSAPAVKSKPGVSTAASALRVRFPEGLLGFPDASHFDLMEGPGSGLFLLAGVEPTSPTLVLADPFAYFDGYEVELAPRYRELVQASHESQIGILAITVPDLETGRWTANLQGPVVVNVTRALAAQVVLTGSSWSVRQPFSP